MDVRDLLVRRGIRPESLPPEEDLNKLERRVKSQERNIAGTAGRLVKKNCGSPEASEYEH